MSRTKPPWIAAKKAEQARKEQRKQMLFSILALVLVGAACIGGVVARFMEMKASADKKRSGAHPQATNEFLPRNSTN